MTPSSFDGLGLAEPLQLALKSENYLKPTPIQAQAIPLLTKGCDLLGIAQTGTGKTAAFALPILHRLFLEPVERSGGAPRALVLAPTRELARQIGERFTAYGKKLPLRTTVIFGGVNQHHQVKALKAGVDILVATPGRLLDLFNQRHVRLDKVSILVLDEADRMLDMGFIRDVRRVVAACKGKRQTLLFSATMPPAIAKLANDILHEPMRIDVSPKTVAVDRIAQRVYFVSAKDKRALLDELLANPAKERVLVFTRTKRGADRVCKQLSQSGISADALHGNKAQNARVRALEAFRTGKVRVLVATDIAARGIDVPNISHVINYELPNEPESYVHRIGRTARAGAGGAAVSFCDHNERPYLKAIERLMQRQVAVAAHRLGFAEAPRDAAGAERRHQPPSKARARVRTRSPHIGEIPMLAAPARGRDRGNRYSGEHR
ncbi:DEAD/DEAH box helicase [Methyloceanibacter sp.]|uniref:DEAD/DEAH box helicase n=1 Tax=Methyloceanibacter sp. TaxID=1965321 RepID=UPI002D61F2C6|nr:DEAD/DEAH box helicase [Methyloceanibacter sp.]HZP09532.1 DEAD/DEAH box helicase [Methyloceanibacter sp.]